MRAFQGLVDQLSYLQVSLNWWDVLQQAVGENIIKQAMEYELPVVIVKASEISACFSEQAETLNVQVKENSRTIVSVTLPADAVLDIECIMPEDVNELIKNSDDINLTSIVNNLRLNGLIPQMLFDFKNGENNYKVWLE